MNYNFSLVALAFLMTHATQSMQNNVPNLKDYCNKLKIAGDFGFDLKKANDQLVTYLTSPDHLNKFSSNSAFEKEMETTLSNESYNVLRQSILEKIDQVNPHITYSPSHTIVNSLDDVGQQIPYSYVQYNNDGSQFLTADYLGKICIYDSLTKKMVASYQPHNEQITCTMFNPINNAHILTASKDRTIVVWDIKQNKRILLLNFDHSVHNAFFSQDGQTIIAASGSLVKTFNALNGKNINTYTFNDRIFMMLPCNKPEMLLLLCEYQTILYNMNTSTIDRITDAIHPDKPDRIAAICKDENETVATTPGYYSIRICDTKKKKEIKELEQIHEDIYHLDFNPKNSKELLVCAENCVHVYDLSIMKNIYTLTQGNGKILTAFFKPNNTANTQEIITASFDGTVSIWEIKKASTFLQNCSLSQLLLLYKLALDYKINTKLINLDLPQNTYLKQLYNTLPIEARKAFQKYVPLPTANKEIQQQPGCIIS